MKGYKDNIIYYKICKSNGESLHNHDNSNIVYEDGKIYKSKYSLNKDINQECGDGIYFIEASQLPLWWGYTYIQIKIVKPLGEIIKVSKGMRTDKIKIIRTIKKQELYKIQEKYNFYFFDKTQTTGNRSTQIAGNESTQKAGYASTQTAGNGSTQTAGNESTQTAGYGSTQIAGNESTQTAGNRSTQTAGYGSTQIAGNESTQKACNESTQTAGYGSTQIAWLASTQKAGNETVQIIYHYSNSCKKWINSFRKVTEKEADKWYKFENEDWRLCTEEEIKIAEEKINKIT